MGKHVREHVELQVDASAVNAGPDASEEEKLRALVKALSDEDVEVEVNTESEEVDT